MMRSSRTRVVAVGVTICTLVTAGLAGCSSSGSGDAQGKVTLKFLDWQPSGPAFWKKTVSDFNATHPNIQVEEQTVPYTDYYTKIGTLAQGNSGPDVIQFDASKVVHNYKDLVVPIDSLVPASVMAGLSAQSDACVQYDCGKGTLGVTFSLQGHPLYYNKRLLQQITGSATAPTTWPDFAATCNKAVSQGTSCWALPAKDIGGIAYTGMLASAMSLQDCADVASGKLKATDPKMQLPFDELSQAAKQGWFPKGSAGAGVADAESTFLTGKSVFFTGLIGDGASWKQLAALGTDLGVMPYPAMTEDSPVPGITPGPLNGQLDAGGGIVTSISKFSKHQAQAAQFLQYLVSTPVQTALALAGSFPANKSVDLKTVNNPTFSDIETLVGKSTGACYPLLPSTSAATTPQIQLIMTGSATPASAAKAVQAAIDKGK